jgi:hypothetical protein
MTCFGAAVNRNNFYFLILLFSSLYVSPSTSHYQVKYIQPFLKGRLLEELRRQAAVARSVEFARGLRPWSLCVLEEPSLATTLQGVYLYFISPIYVSALAGHLQAEYTIFSGSYLTTTDPLFLCYRSYFVYGLANTDVVYLICEHVLGY